MRKLLWLLTAVNTVAAAVLTIARTEYPTKAYWTRLATVLLACALVTVIFPTLHTLVVENGERKKRKKLQRETAFNQMLTAALVAITNQTELDCTTTGVQAFLVERTWKWKLKPWWKFIKYPSRVRVHARAGRVKLRFSPPPSGITWTEGKGLIGKCWARRGNVSVDLRTHFGPYGGYTEAQWNALGSEERYGLTFEEFSRTRGAYGIMVAVPILDAANKYLGCVSLDAPPDCPVNVDIPWVEGALRVPAVAIQHLLASRD